MEHNPGYFVFNNLKETTEFFYVVAIEILAAGRIKRSETGSV